MRRTLILGATLLAFGMAGQASADTDISIGLGEGYGQPGLHYVRDGGVSCRQGVRIVRSAGFRNVHATNCSGRTYEYRGYSRNRLYQISVLSRSGRIVNVQRLRDGDYGDDYDEDEY